MQINNSITDVKIVSLERYKETKNLASSEAKDQLIESLCKLAYVHDLSDQKIPISAKSSKCIDEWCAIQSTSTQNLELLLTRKLNNIIRSAYPNCDAEYSLNEISLATRIKKINPEIAKIKCLKPLDKIEIWIVCDVKDYSVLEKATDLINDYQAKYHTSIDCVFTARNQLIKERLPRFDFEL
jgi:hypothetical protein